MSAHTNKVGTRIMTASGQYFDFLKPELYTFDIEAIAHSLSLQCRWTGNCKSFYSIAEHSTRCSYLVPKEHALAAVLHDAVESVTGDCSTPLKKLLNRFSEIEHAAEEVLMKQFKISVPLHPCVKSADLIMLCTEKRDLMGDNSAWEMLDGVLPLPKTIKPWGHEKAKRKFLERYYEITKENV